MSLAYFETIDINGNRHPKIVPVSDIVQIQPIQPHNQRLVLADQSCEYSKSLPPEVQYDNKKLSAAMERFNNTRKLSPAKSVLITQRGNDWSEYLLSESVEEIAARHPGMVIINGLSAHDHNEVGSVRTAPPTVPPQYRRENVGPR